MKAEEKIIVDYMSNYGTASLLKTLIRVVSAYPELQRDLSIAYKNFKEYGEKEIVELDTENSMESYNEEMF
jgi:hypothetical protein